MLRRLFSKEFSKFWYALFTAIAATSTNLALASNDDLITTEEWLMTLTLFVGPFVVLSSPKNLDKPKD